MFAAGLSASLVLGLRCVVAGTMSVGDLVAVNSLLLQLSVPFNFMGYTYQELRQSLVDMSYVRNVLFNVEARIQDTYSDVDMDVVAPRNGSRYIRSP
jgi:ABC-type transport system involved in Fe-S cluster assembly fused permease/ATPase subunit